MEHLADEAVAGADQTTLRTAIKDHLTNCPDCHEHHQHRLEQMEDKIFARTGQTEEGRKI
jgi:hypothetical protein